MLLLLLVFFILRIPSFGTDQHQWYIYTSTGYSKQILDTYQNIYDTSEVSTGIGYRWNKFLSKESIHYFSIGLSLGGGIIFPQQRKRQQILIYNSFLELVFKAGYGVGFGSCKQHQLPIFGISFIPRFFGLLERNNFTQIGGTEVEWYKGFYIPFSLGIHLPSYRYVHHRFFIGFLHSLNFLVFGNYNINVPKEHLILHSLGYQFKLQVGLNYDKFSNINRNKELKNTMIFVEIHRNKALISLLTKVEKETTKSITVEVFALNDSNEKPTLQNLMAYASKIPVYNSRSQFTKYWKGKQKILYFAIKELDENENMLFEQFHFYDLREVQNNKIN